MKTGFMTALLISTLCISAQSADEYRLFLSTKKKPATITTSAEDVIVWVNNNPIEIVHHAMDSVSLLLNPWIRKGTNSVHLTGLSERELEMNVVKNPSEKSCGSLKVLLKDKRKSEQLIFNVNEEVKSLLSNTSAITNKTSLPDDARAFLADINKIIEARDYKKFMKLMEERVKFQSSLYELDYASMLPEAEAYWKENIGNVEPIDIDALSYVIGESSILLYRKSEERAYFLTIGNNKAPPIVIVKMNGKWIMW